MKYSILYKLDEPQNVRDIIYDLSIDRSVANISADIMRNEYFCGILARPLTKHENIEYRREILADFLNTPGLLENVKTAFRRYDKLKTDWLQLKGTGDAHNTDNSSEVMLEYIYSSLKVTALFPKTILSLFSTVKEVLSQYELKSEGLCAIRDYADKMIKDESLNEIADIASLFMYNSPKDYDFELLCIVGDTLKVEASQICGVKRKSKQKNNIFGNLLKKKKKDSTYLENSESAARDDALFILGESLHQIDALLEDITDSVYSTFYGIAHELDFYDVACNYVKFLDQRFGRYCFAELGEEISFEDLYDLFLASESDMKLYPNSFSFGGFYGAMLKGKNNTGKTTFLRSLGTAQIFTQAGLPIPARDAVLPVFEAVFTHFSSAEEDFRAGDASGRFEGEVRAMAQIIDSLEPRSLILLNETFQTTAYDEGSRGMAAILKVLIKTKSRFVFVTHLLDLFDMLDEKVIKLESASGDDPFTIKQI